MVDKNLIEKITSEVLAKLQTTAGGGNGAPAAKSGTDDSGNGSGGRQSSVTAPSGIPASGAPAATRGWQNAANRQTSQAQQTLTPADIPPYIDHTLLRADASQAEIDKLCDEAMEYHFWSVCVNTTWVGYCAKKLQGSGVKVCTVVGFPLGAMAGRAKNFETRHAIENGAREIDMVINIGALKSGNHKLVEEDIKWVRRACTRNIVLKVIIENALLTDEEKVFACEISKKAGADFVKTSTGFSTHGARIEDVALMRRTVGPKMGIKAAGGIRSFDDAIKMIQTGATRLGTSSGVAIVTGSGSTKAY